MKAQVGKDFAIRKIRTLIKRREAERSCFAKLCCQKRQELGDARKYFEMEKKMEEVLNNVKGELKPIRQRELYAAFDLNEAYIDPDYENNNALDSI